MEPVIDSFNPSGYQSYFYGPFVYFRLFALFMFGWWSWPQPFRCHSALRCRWSRATLGFLFFVFFSSQNPQSLPFSSTFVPFTFLSTFSFLLNFTSVFCNVVHADMFLMFFFFALCVCTVTEDSVQLIHIYSCNLLLRNVCDYTDDFL